MRFYNREDAGKALAKKLLAYKDRANTLVLALPRGGVPVAYQIAGELHLPLDIMLVRKLGVPGHEELAMGAIANGHVQVLNEEVVRSLSIPPSIVEKVVAAEHKELERRNQEYRDGRPAPKLQGKTVILVDDGMATGANMRAAVDAVKQQAARIVVAAPIASNSAYSMLTEVADEVICVEVPDIFYGVGQFYADFSQTSDDEVKALLKQAVRQPSASEPASEKAYGHRRA
jgi:putative phosphoribosyl transferase